MLANPTASSEVSTLGAIRMNREQARSYRCNRVPVNGYVTGLGREQPNLFLSNNTQESARSLIVRYAGRNRVEDALGISVNFFHLDCLASEVRLNRHFVETSGAIELEHKQMVVRFNKRSHNPILREAALDQPRQPIPWLQHLPVVFRYP